MEVNVRILSAKKLQPNHKQYLLNAGLAVIEADFIAVAPKPFVADDIAPNLIFTSANGFKSFLLHKDCIKYKDCDVFCVGSSTRQVIERHGYNVIVFENYAAELARVITDGYRDRRFTFFSGSMRRDTLPETLTKAGVAFNEIEVYETVLTPHKINAVIDGVLFFSPAAVESFLQLNKIKNETCFCIGTTTADALKGITDNIVIANKPTVENVIVQCINYYKLL